MIVTITVLKKSINKLPTNGNIKNAIGAGPNLFTIEFILAIPLGVAPKPNPQCPAARTAAS